MMKDEDVRKGIQCAARAAVGDYETRYNNSSAAGRWFVLSSTENLIPRYLGGVRPQASWISSFQESWARALSSEAMCWLQRMEIELANMFSRVHRELAMLSMSLDPRGEERKPNGSFKTGVCISPARLTSGRESLNIELCLPLHVRRQKRPPTGVCSVGGLEKPA